MELAAFTQHHYVIRGRFNVVDGMRNILGELADFIKYHYELGEDLMSIIE